MKPLAILGGTFDPVHVGHLRVAWEVAEALDAELRMIPAHDPWHRHTKPPVASAAQRMRMLELALAGQDRLVADGRELRRAGPTYTVDTLLELRAEFGPERPLVVAIGADAFAGLSSWHRWRELFELAHFAVLTRPGHEGAFEAEVAGEWYARRVQRTDALRAKPSGSVLALAVTALEISASRVRALLAEGRDPRFLLSDPVAEYIRAEGLYASTRT
jgi:nicotinate-nucleotide adenylyltransferase